MKSSFWSIKSRRWLWLMMFLFLMFEVALRLKFGSLFTLAFIWFFVHQWLIKKTLAEEFSTNPIEKIMVSIYYATIICIVIFVIFSILNAGIRTLNNEWRYFQPP